MRTPALKIIAAGVAAAVGLSVSARAALRAGAAAVDVTPHHLPIRVAWSIGERYADEINTPLHAKAIALDDGGGGGAIIMATVDNCLVGRDLFDAAKAHASEKTGIPPERMLISATHTHSAPPVTGVHGSDPEVEYARELEAKLVLAIVLATKRLAPAEIAWAAGRCDEHVFCRRWLMEPGTAHTVKFTGHEANRAQMNPGHDNPNKIEPTGPVDPAVTVLAVRSADGEPLAVFANYSTHYVGAGGVSADYFGVFGDLIGPMLGAPEGNATDTAAGGGFVGILSNGTSGDANCVDFSKAERQAFDMHSVAKRVAEIAVAALGGAEFRGDVRIRMADRDLNLAVRMPSDDEVAAARAYLDEHVGDRSIRDWDENYARETVLLSELPATRDVKLQAVAFDDAFAVTAIPCEVYGSTGLALKEASPFPLTMNVSMANGADGYLPPPEQHKLGGYTTWRARSSCLEVDAEPRIRSVLEEMLNALHDK